MDLVFILNNVDIASYADDDTPYIVASDINGVITSLKKSSKAFFEWFKYKLLKSNGDKCTEYMDLPNRRIFMNAFFHSQFNYCPLVWMCTTNRKINRLHERCLCITCNEKQSSFEELLEKDGFVSVDDKNIQYIAVEMYKVSNGLSPRLISGIFK